MTPGGRRRRRKGGIGSVNEWAAAAAPLLHGCWAEPRRCLPFPLPLPAAFCVRLAPLGAPQPCSTSSSSSSSCCSSSTSSSSSSTTTTPRRSREAGKRRYARPGITGLSRGNRSPPPPAEAWLCACLPPAGKATKGNGGRRAGADEGPEVLGGGMRRALPRPRFSRWRCWAKSFSSRRSAASNALQYWGWGRNGGQMDRDGGQRGPKWHQNGVSGV